jgi:hypothetical protein
VNSVNEVELTVDGMADLEKVTTTWCFVQPGLGTDFA